METCAECDKPIYPGQASYYSKGPLDCIGKTYHSGCGDPLGTKATARRIADLEAALARLRDDIAITQAIEKLACATLDIETGERQFAGTFAHLTIEDCDEIAALLERLRKSDN